MIVNDDGSVLTIKTGESTTINLPSPANGGNLVLRAGSGQRVENQGRLTYGQDGSVIIQRGDGVESMRFDPDGSVFVRGELMDSNKEVYEEFRHWLNEIWIGRIHDE